MSYISVLQGTATWLPFIASNANDGSPRTGITFNQVDISFKKSTQATFQLKVISGSDFRENGNGVYEILFSTSDLNTIGSFLYVVNGNGVLPLPSIKQFIGQAVVQSSSTFTPGTISLPTNLITGNLISLTGTPLIGESISARIMSAPTIIGTTPNIGGIASDIIATKTDSGGFFAIEILQRAVVDITIPVINYRRTLTVPANATDKLFDIP
jgi:hypothetical protein